MSKIGKTTIKVEDRLREIFAYLPEIAGPNNLFQPIFKAGDQKELIAFFEESQGNSNYPLIWLDMPYDEEHFNRKRTKINGLSLILAVETNSEMLYDERLKTTFANVLYPLLDSILDAFTVSNTLSYDSNFSIMKYGNYSEQAEGTEGEFVDIWDAIKLTLDVEINDTCLREIKI